MMAFSLPKSYVQPLKQRWAFLVGASLLLVSFTAASSQAADLSGQ